MTKKTIIAILLSAVSLFIIVFLRQLNILWFDALMMVFLTIAVIELDNAFRRAGYNTMRSVLYFAVIAVLPMYLYLGFQGAVMTLVLGFMIGATTLTFNHKYSYKDLVATSFILIYPMLFMIIFAEVNHKTGGFFGIFSIIFIAVMSDTFAQWVGMLIKGPKLCPSISPNKTIAGSVGAYIGGILGAIILFLLFEYFVLFENIPNVYFTGLTSNKWLSLPLYLLLGIVGATTAQLGDLFASWLKRQFNIKDFGAILPGHGGIMDRADSMIYTAPLLYLIFLFIPALAQ